MNTIGWVGLGNMGLPMAQRILAAGAPMWVWARNPAQTLELKRQALTLPPTLSSSLNVLASSSPCCETHLTLNRFTLPCCPACSPIRFLSI